MLAQDLQYDAFIIIIAQSSSRAMSKHSSNKNIQAIMINDETASATIRIFPVSTDVIPMTVYFIFEAGTTEKVEVDGSITEHQPCLNLPAVQAVMAGTVTQQTSSTALEAVSE